MLEWIELDDAGIEENPDSDADSSLSELSDEVFNTASEVGNESDYDTLHNDTEAQQWRRQKASLCYFN